MLVLFYDGKPWNFKKVKVFSRTFNFHTWKVYDFLLKEIYMYFLSQMGNPWFLSQIITRSFRWTERRGREPGGGAAGRAGAAPLLLPSGT